MPNDLSDARARRIAPGDKPQLIGGVPGLYLHPASTRGNGKWIMRFMSPITGKRRDMGLGSYPERGIADVRREGLRWRQDIAAGRDPIEMRNAERQKVSAPTAAIPTFEEAARSSHADRATGFRNSKHAAQWLTTLETYIFPSLGSLQVDELTPVHFADALRPIWLSKVETASRIRQRCDAVMKWAAARGYVTASPLSAVSELLPKQPGLRERVKHQPAVPWRGVGEIVQTVLRSGRLSTSKLALELLILTAARSGEVRGMAWEEIDFQEAVWTIPAARTKTNTAQRIPLADRTLQILHHQHDHRDGSVYVFPSRSGRPLSDMALTKLLRDKKVASDTPGRFATAHGFRSSFRDWASENSYPRDLAERALGHTIRNAVEAAYHRTDLLEERRGMMAAWADAVSKP